jgi:hypothetical protein
MFLEEGADGDGDRTVEQCEFGDVFVSTVLSVDIVEDGKRSSLALREGESSTYFEGSEFSSTGDSWFDGGDGDLETSIICMRRFLIGTSAGISLNRQLNCVDPC